MSRPASRGADSSSPIARRPRRNNDPMTDSDFYTESDDHEDQHQQQQQQQQQQVQTTGTLRGDRRARVIDGTLYGVNARAAADVYANNRWVGESGKGWGLNEPFDEINFSE